MDVNELISRPSRPARWPDPTNPGRSSETANHLIPGVTEFSAPTATCEFPAATQTVRPALLPRTSYPGAQRNSGPFIRYSSCSTSRLWRACWRRGDVSPLRRRSPIRDGAARSTLRAALAHRFSGCAAATTASRASSLLHCACVAPSQKPCCRHTCLRCGHDGGVRWPAGRVQ